MANKNSRLMEAAAEVLKQSQANAESVPPQSLNTGVVDLGGPTPFNYKSTDDSAKVNTTAAAQSATPPQTQPSGAGVQLPSLSKEEVNTDMSAMFAGETLSEDFKSKAAIIFEARVEDRVNQIKEQLEEDFANQLSEAVNEISKELTEKVNDYLSYVVEHWLEDNQLAVDNGIRTELTEDFISGLRNLFAEHYIDVPEDKVDIVDELCETVADLESKLDEQIEINIRNTKELVSEKRKNVLSQVSEGLTDTQVEKLKQLAESVEFVTEDEYKNKLEVIRENYFPTNAPKKANVTQFQESIEEKPSHEVTNDFYVNAVAAAISRTKK